MFINCINWHTLFNKINAAQVSVYLVLPSIDEEIAQLLIDVKNESPILISVCVDNSEDAIRNGYGDSKGIETLIENDINLRESKGNRVSFIIIDNTGFMLFPESRIFSADPTGPNAIELDAFTISRLIAYYFPPFNETDKEHLRVRLENSIGEQTNWMKEVGSEIINDNQFTITEEFVKEDFSVIKKSLENNKPISPDLQRQIKTYTAKVQFVELRFTGINFHSRTISIPEDAFPINNKELKKLLQTKMKLFQNIENNKDFSVFLALKKKVDEIREDYLKPITCREGKSLIEIGRKEAFIACVEDIKKEIIKINKQLPDILESATYQTKDLIKAELSIFFKENEPVEIQQYQDAALKQRKLNEFVDRHVYRIPFPKTEKLIEKISLSDYYYDLTFQDFSDENLIRELKKKKIMKDEDINGIVEMKIAFAEKK